MADLEKKVALITGASRGLGYAVSKLLATKGIHIIGLARTVGGLESLSDEITNSNGTSTMVPLDLKNMSQLESLGNSIFDRWKKVDIFIHCACIPTAMSPVTTVSLKDFEKSITINTLATLKLIQILDPLIKTSKVKKMVFVDDKKSGKFLSSYAASKAASRELVESYKEESKRIGTQVIVFTPKPMPTRLRAKFYPGERRSRLSSCLLEAERMIKIAKL